MIVEGVTEVFGLAVHEILANPRFFDSVWIFDLENCVSSIVVSLRSIVVSL